jgi:murein DD-endopeptidase MepM/ murein hydrolase activator NlpD
MGGASGRIGEFGPTRFYADGRPKLHKGVDLLCVFGWPVFAVQDGVAVAAGWENEADTSQGYGRRVRIESGGGMLVTVYAHLASINVKQGHRVARGDVIGTAGRSGNVGTDMVAVPTHLHFEVWVGEASGATDPVDPELWFLGGA